MDMNESTIQALFRICEGDNNEDNHLTWRSSLVREHTVQFAHHKGLDYVSISTHSESFEQSKMAGPISWSVIRNTSLNDDMGAMILEYQSNERRRVATFLIEMIEATDEKNGLKISIAMEIAKEWEKMWSNFDSPLSHQKQNGLYAELIVLENLMYNYGDVAIQIWEGPENGLHDFVYDEKSLEVKSHGTLSKLIKVSNMEQLAPISNGILELCCVGIGRDSEGRSLNDLVDRIYSTLNVEDSKLKFKQKLSKAGYDSRHASHYTAKKNVKELRLGKITVESLTFHKDKLAIPNPALKNAAYTLDSAELDLHPFDLDNPIITL
jgi:hypothetical protein